MTVEVDLDALVAALDATELRKSGGAPEVIVCRSVLELIDRIESQLTDLRTAEEAAERALEAVSGEPGLLLCLIRLRLLLLPLAAAVAERRTNKAAIWAERSLRPDPISGSDSPNAWWPTYLLDGDAGLDALSVPVIQRWLTGFYCAIRGNQLATLGSSVRDWAESRLETWLDRGVGDELALEAAFALVSWANSEAGYAADAQELQFALSTLPRNPNVSPRNRARAAVFNASTDAGWSFYFAKRFAAHLAGHRENLPPVDRIKALGLEHRMMKRGDLLPAIEAADAVGGLRSGLGMGRRDQVFSATLTEPAAATAAALAENGEYEAAVLLLSRSLGIDEGQRLVDPVLAIAGERSMIWANRCAVSQQSLIGSMHDLNEEFASALRTNGPDVSRRGTFDNSLGHSLENSIQRYLRAEQLESAFSSRDEAAGRPPIVLLPWIELPVQATMIKRFGFTGELSLSLQAPHPDREIRRIAFWTHGVNTVGYEIDALKAALPDAIDLQVLRDGDGASFADVWADSSYDVVWISAHGELDRTERDIALCVGDRLVLTSHELAELPRPASEKRRLVVLNVCDSAATETFGGLSGLGLAASICGADQAVIGHLWPAEVLESAAFGALLGSRFQAGRGLFASFEDAMRVFVGSGSELADGLRALGAGALADRIDRPLGPSYVRSIGRWGSPAFLA